MSSLLMLLQKLETTFNKLILAGSESVKLFELVSDPDMFMFVLPMLALGLVSLQIPGLHVPGNFKSIKNLHKQLICGTTDQI